MNQNNHSTLSTIRNVQSNSINQAMAIINDKENREISDQLRKHMNTLKTELIKIHKAQQNSSALMKTTKNIPLVGGMLQRYVATSLENKLDDSKQIIYHLKEAIDQNCNKTRESAERLNHLSNVIKSDIAHNKKEKDDLEILLTSIPNTQKDSLTDSRKATIAKQINELSEYINVLIVQEAQIENILRESSAFITSIEFSARKALACIATSIVTHQHVELERQTMELVKKCNNVVGEVLLGTANSIKEKSEEFQDFLINSSVDPKKVEEAIKITKDTFDNMVKFNSERLPILLENVKKSSQSIKEIQDRLNFIKQEKDTLMILQTQNQGGENGNVGVDKK